MLENSDRKNDYFALICRKKVSLLDSGRRMVTLQYSGWMENYLARFWQRSVIWQESVRNLVIQQDFGRKLLYCKILAEWTGILQDPDKNIFLGKFWRKEWLSRVNLSKNGYSVRFWWKRLSCNVLAKKCHFGRIREKFGYPARFDRKLFSCKILAEWMVILQYADKNGYLEGFR